MAGMLTIACGQSQLLGIESTEQVQLRGITLAGVGLSFYLPFRIPPQTRESKGYLP